MKPSNEKFIELLKDKTDIDHEFITKFCIYFEIGDNKEFKINYKDVAKFLEISNDTLLNRLQNKYSDGESYKENIDFTKVKTSSQNVDYMLNYPCFEKICMASQTERGAEVRSYFSKLRTFLTDYQEKIYEIFNNSTIVKDVSKNKCIYIIALDENKDIYKIGRTENLANRIKNYQVGKIDNVDIKYLAIVEDPLLIENCIKLFLNKYQYKEKTEIYKMSLTEITYIIEKCYAMFKKYFNKDGNLDEQLELIKNLFDMHKMQLFLHKNDKTTRKFQPYVIINHDINTDEE